MNIQIRSLLTALLLGLGVVKSAAAAEGTTSSTTSEFDPTCPDSNILGSGMITDICWSCIFPMRINGIKLGDGNVPDGAADGDFVCICDDQNGVPEFGIQMSMWEPARIMEVVRTPYCSPTLDGTRFMNDIRLMGSPKRGDADTSKVAFYQYHYLAFPLFTVLDLFLEPDCNKDGYSDIDIINFSELDPTWNDDELGFFLNPEAALFANPIALSACIGDGIAATAGNPSQKLFWCAGTWGNLYPFSGHINYQGSPPRDTSLIAVRGLAAQHRRGLARGTMGDKNICKATFEPTIPKSQYKFEQIYPVAESDGNHWIGQSTYTWGEWRNVPGTGEDFVHMIWRWNDCCVR